MCLDSLPTSQEQLQKLKLKQPRGMGPQWGLAWFDSGEVQGPLPTAYGGGAVHQVGACQLHQGLEEAVALEEPRTEGP